MELMRPGRRTLLVKAQDVYWLGYRERWRLKLKPDALNPCRYWTSLSDCIRGTGDVAVLLPSRNGTKA